MTETETIALAGTIATDNLVNDVESPPLLPPSSTPILGSRSIGDTLPSNSCTSTLEIRPGSSSLGGHQEQPPAISKDSLLPESFVAEPALEFEPGFDVLSHFKDVTFCSLRLLTPWFPEVNPEHSRSRTWRTWRSRRQVVLWTCFATAGLICIINFVSFGVTRLKFRGMSDDVVTLHRGDCTSVRSWDRGIHIIINILSTLLMGASNLTLQLIAAPTRKEVDRAHAKGIWLDIGVPSVKNLLSISRLNLLIWCCLAVSSLPIHFLYNSAVFSSLTVNQFGYAVVTEGFLTGSAWNTNRTTGCGPVVSESLYDNRAVELDSFSFVSYMQKDYQGNLTKYHNLTKLECLNAYSNPLGPEPNLLLISSDEESSECFNSSLLSWGFHGPIPNEITHKPLCSLSFSQKQCGLSDFLTAEKLGAFELGNHSIDYCLNRPTDPAGVAAQACHLQCSPRIILIVAIFNGIKCICILLVTLWKREPTLSILGDAIASFLSQPDEYTKHLGITSKGDIIRSDKSWSGDKGRALLWDSRPSRWYSAASNRRWVFTVASSILFILFGVYLTAKGFHHQVSYKRSISVRGLWATGFGTPNIETIAQGQDGLLVNIIESNLLQVLLSMLYMLHNALLSCMMVAIEWNGFIIERKTLRVSAPEGIQRSSYFVSMPLRYGIPIMILFSTEHWLVSQSYFIIRVVRIDWTGIPDAEWTIRGFSLGPAILALILSVLILFVQALHGYMRKFSNEISMPFASTCSAAISANCHRPEADKESHLLPVQWGVIEEDGFALKQCSFTTSRYVKAPTPGHEYLTFRAKSVRNSRS